MLYALDQNNARIEPIKGVDAKCLYCFDKVIAACGQINIHHWRHESYINCDPWKEHETEWHRQWKHVFPERWREVIITRNNEKHIADIQTDSGFVLELQNSSISSTTIQIREKFYGRMVWLINAVDFKDNISKYSRVKSSIRDIKERYNSYRSEGNNIEDSLEYFYNKLKEIDKEIDSLNTELIRINRDIDKSLDYKDNLEETISKLLKSNLNSNLLNDFKSINIEDIRELNKLLLDIDNKLLDFNNRLTRIYSFPLLELSSLPEYRKIDFKDVSSFYYSICKVIDKDSLKTFFPKVIDIRSELEFNSYSYRKDNYQLVIDLTKNTQSILESISQLEKEKETLVAKKELQLELLNIEVITWLDELYDLKIQSKKELNYKRDEVKQREVKLNKELEEQRKILEVESIKDNEKLNAEQKSEEFHVMRSQKGQYKYTWKHRRKTWDFANCPIFMDIGTDIYQIISEEILIKITTEDFISKIKNLE